MKFKAGDIVVLTGQFARMTVSHSFGEGDSEQTVCLWFDNKFRLQRANFLSNLLEPAVTYVAPVPMVYGSHQ